VSDLIVYVDGYNLFHGLRSRYHDDRYQWLDLVSLSRLLRRGDNLVKVNYYTAPLKGTPTAISRQQTYFGALQAALSEEKSENLVFFAFDLLFEGREDLRALPLTERKRLMDEHIRVGLSYPRVKLNTTYSFGIDDQEFVVAFETNFPEDFLDLVQQLRETEISMYTLQDTPIFSCVAMSVARALDALDGAATARGVAAVA